MPEVLRSKFLLFEVQSALQLELLEFQSGHDSSMDDRRVLDHSAVDDASPRNGAFAAVNDWLNKLSKCTEIGLSQ